MSPLFLRRISSHNRHAVVAAALSLLGAWVAWTIAYGLFVGVILGALTVANGQEVLLGERLMSVPAWLRESALVAALLLLVWAAVDERVNRFRPASDRPVIGWHILGDILLLPPRLTFGVGHQLAAIIRLNPSERAVAYDLLRMIYEEKRCLLHALGALFPDTARLRKLLFSLQLAGWIDLLRTEDGWIYIVKSTEAEEVAGMFGAADESEGEAGPGEDVT